MVPGFRYHVITVIAIFLALGVGIVIGSSFVQSAIVEKQAGALDSLRVQFARDVVPLREQNARYASFVGALAPALMSTRLANQRIALVQTGDYPDAVRRARESLEQAGATVASVTVIERTFPARSGVSQTGIFAKLQPAHPELASGGGSVMRILANAVARGETPGDMSALVDAKLVAHDGDYSRPVDAVVLIGGASEEAESRADSVDLQLLAELKSLGARAVFAEPESAGISYINALRSADVATVDNVDTDLGRIALVLAITASPGDYGVKKTARGGPIPASPTR